MSVDLTKVGGPQPGQDYEKLAKTVRDTVIVAPETELTNEMLFTSGHKNAKYKTANFPSQSQAFQLLGLRITPHILFDLTNAESQTSKLATLLGLSRLGLIIEGNVVFDEYIEQYCNFDLVPNGVNAAGEAYLGVREKFTNYFKFPTPIIIAAGASFEVEFKPVSGLETAAANAAADMHLPDAGLTNDIGHAIYFDFITQNVKVRG